VRGRQSNEGTQTSRMGDHPVEVLRVLKSKGMRMLVGIGELEFEKRDIGWGLKPVQSRTLSTASP